MNFRTFKIFLKFFTYFRFSLFVISRARASLFKFEGRNFLKVPLKILFFLDIFVLQFVFLNLRNVPIESNDDENNGKGMILERNRLALTRSKTMRNVIERLRLREEPKFDEEVKDRNTIF